MNDHLELGQSSKRNGSGRSFSVTEVRNALRCPRIFALGRLCGHSVAFPVGSSCLGASFHRIVERFAREVASPPPAFARLSESSARDDVEASLVHWLMRLLVDELESDAGYATVPGEVDDLAEALREFARHLTGRLARSTGGPTTALPKVVRSGERSIEAVLFPGGATIRGRLDALFGGNDEQLEIVEYKLTDEANDALDRAQVALYRRLLDVAEGVPARPTVLRFSPTLRETTLSASDADDLVDRLLLPIVRDMPAWADAPSSAPATTRRDLCAVCPVAQSCAETYPSRLPVRDDPPAAAARPRPGVAGTIQASQAVPTKEHGSGDEEGRREAEQLKELVLAELKRQGVAAVCPAPPVVGPTLYLLEVSRPRGPVQQLDKAWADVAHRLADRADIEYQKRGGHRHFVITRKKRRPVMLARLLEERRSWLEEKPGRFVVGQKPDGDVVVGDFADSSTPHLLVGGQAGSGKSVLLQALVASLVQFHGPERIRFTLVDPKRVTFNVPSFQSAIAAHLDGPVRYDAEETLPLIEQLVDVMEERYRCFEEAKVTSLDEHNELAAPSQRLERKVLVIDEFQDLTAEKHLSKAFFEGVKRLGAKARAAGVHLVLATQRPDKDTVPPIVKANLGGRIALRVTSLANSRIILDEGGAEKLLGKGDLLANLGHGVVRAQGPLIG